MSSISNLGSSFVSVQNNSVQNKPSDFGFTELKDGPCEGLRQRWLEKLQERNRVSETLQAIYDSIKEFLKTGLDWARFLPRSPGLKTYVEYFLETVAATGDLPRNATLKDSVTFDGKTFKGAEVMKELERRASEAGKLGPEHKKLFKEAENLFQQYQNCLESGEQPEPQTEEVPQKADQRVRISEFTRGVNPISLEGLIPPRLQLQWWSLKDSCSIGGPGTDINPANIDIPEINSDILPSWNQVGEGAKVVLPVIATALIVVASRGQAKPAFSGGAPAEDPFKVETLLEKRRPLGEIIAEKLAQARPSEPEKYFYETKSPTDMTFTIQGFGDVRKTDKTVNRFVVREGGITTLTPVSVYEKVDGSQKFLIDHLPGGLTYYVDIESVKALPTAEELAKSQKAGTESGNLPVLQIPLEAEKREGWKPYLDLTNTKVDVENTKTTQPRPLPKN